MPIKSTRRNFVQASAAGVAALTGGLAFLSRLPRVSADEARLGSGVVSFDQNIEPLVRLIEDTPRDTLLEQVADRIHKGRSYQEVLAAILLAGIRNVQPRPSVGFKFHCVLVVNSCHLASLSGPDEDRWLPIFWAIDYFKSAQADERERSGWKMQPVNESLVPDAVRARSMFIEAMDTWDVDKADAATAGLVRTTGATEIFNLFAQYAARDFRSIGHKAIYLANSWRTLQAIGWQFAEPVLRSLSFALLNHSGEPNPANSDLNPDRPWRQNVELLNRVPPNWQSGRLDDGVPNQLIESFRQTTPFESATIAADALASGVGPQSIWDGVFVGAGELLMQQPGIIGLHGLTTANAMHFLWQHSADDAVRQRLLLQACSFNPLFRESANARGNVGKQLVTTLQPTAPANDADALPAILSQISSNRMTAAESVLGYLSAGGSANQFVHATRKTLFMKGRDAHDYKFSSAVMEDYNHVSTAWRNRFLATSVFNLKGSGHPDNALVTRTRTALKG